MRANGDYRIDGTRTNELEEKSSVSETGTPPMGRDPKIGFLESHSETLESLPE